MHQRTDESTRASTVLRYHARFCGGFALLVGALVLVGWWLEHAPLLSLGFRTMAATTGVMSAIAGTSLLVLAPRGASRARAVIGTGCAGALGILAALTLAGHLVGFDLGIHPALASGELTEGDRLQPSWQTAAAFSVVAVALWTMDTERRLFKRLRISELLAITVAMFALVVLAGYAFRVAELHGPEGLLAYTGMGVLSAATLLVLSSGIVAARAELGVFGIVTAKDSGGVVARQLVTWQVALVPAVAAIVLGAYLYVYSTAFASAAVFLLTLFVGTAFVLRAAWRLSALDAVRAEAEEYRARLASLVESSHDPIVAMTLDGIVTHWNAGAERLYGYSSAEMLGRDVRQLVPPDRIDELCRTLETVRDGKSASALETVRTRKDGSRVPVLTTCSPIVDGAGRVLGISSIATDLTERIQAEERIRQAQERFELALKGADLGAWDWNIATGEVIFNARWAELRGFRLDEVRPHVGSWASAVHPDDWPRVQQALADHFEGRTPIYDCEHRVRSKAGDWMWILDRGAVFARDEHGRPTRMVGTELDITERKRLERSLRESHADLDRAQSVAKTGSWRLDLQRDVLVWSDESYRIFGRPPGTPMNYQGFLDCVHPEDRAYVDRMWAAARRGEPYDIEHRLLVDGTVKWVREKADLEFDDQGVLRGGMGITQDITERKQAEEALRLSEARFSGIVSLSADAIISIDDDQRITLFNEGAERIFGYSKAEAIGASLDLLLPERLHASHRAEVAKFAAGQEVARRMGTRGRAILGRRKNGEEFPADAAISKLEVGGQRVMTATVRDVTEEKRIEYEQKFLAEAGAVLSASLEYGDTLAKIAELAVEQLANLCIVHIFEEEGGIRPLEATCRDPAHASLCEAFVHGPLDSDHQQLVLASLAAEQPILVQRMPSDIVEVLSRSEAHARLFRALDLHSIIAVPLVTRDKLVGAITLGSAAPSRLYGHADVRLAEELARRASLAIENARLYRTAMRAIQARDDVLAIVAHDLRNPLSSVLLQTELLRDLAAERDRSALDRIANAATRMDRLIQDLLDVTRIDVGRLSIERARISAEQVVTDAVEAQTSLAEGNSLELDLAVAPGLPAVSADRERLMQALANLIGNACKFTDPGGRITVGAVPRTDEVVFSVRDTGPGIASEDVPHLFDRFWQVHKTDRRGAGLGLAIVKGIVEAHGGRIWVDSQLGIGTTVYFTVPVATAADQTSAASPVVADRVR